MSDSDIINNVSSRHLNFNLDFDLINKQLKECKSSILKSGMPWNSKKFKRNELTSANAVPGIYMFVLKPFEKLPILSSDFIIYHY